MSLSSVRMEASERPEASLKRLAQHTALIIIDPSEQLIDWMNRSSLVDFTEQTVVGANSMCRVGSCLQLFQSVLWSANTFLVVVHSSLIGFFPNSTWLDYSVQNCFPPCLGFFFSLLLNFILPVSVQLAAGTSCYYPSLCYAVAM